MDALRNIINECLLVGAGFEPARFRVASDVSTTDFEK
jgi:hypothetical protein